MVGPQDTYEAGPNVNGVIRPNSGANISTTSHVYIYIHYICKFIYIHLFFYFYLYTCLDFMILAILPSGFCDFTVYAYIYIYYAPIMLRFLPASWHEFVFLPSFIFLYLFIFIFTYIRLRFLPASWQEFLLFLSIKY